MNSRIRRWLPLAAAVLSSVVVKCQAAEGQIASSLFVRVTQSSDGSATNAASRAMDAQNGTFSLTADAPGSYWLAELGRPFLLTRIEVVNRSAPSDVEMDGLTLRLLNMDDQVVFETGLTNPGSAATQVVNLPENTKARIVWIGLPGTQTNGAGNYRVGLAEVRAYGVLNTPYCPEPIVAPTNALQVWQSSEYGGASYPAGNAVDGATNNFTHTAADLPNSYWMADMGAAYRIDRVELQNRPDCCNNRFINLILRIYDGASNQVASANVTDPGLNGLFTYTPPGGTTGRWIRVGLEGGQTNGGGNYVVSINEARVFSGTTNLLATAATPQVPVTNNLASFKNSYMLRLINSLASATNANDNNLNTESKTTTQTVDGYWEVDLGATYALYGVRTIAASGIGSKMTNATVRLYDEAHNSVFGQRLSGKPDAFDSDVNGPVFARYVRVGLENKKRTSPTGSTEWYIGMREVEVFGRATNGLGLLSFTASTQQVVTPQPVTLGWAVEDIRRVEIHPALGSVGAYTATSGVGSIVLTPSNSTEYVMIASNAVGRFTGAVSVEVDGVPLTVRISEFVAENKFSLTDGRGDASDWIELRNPGNSAVNLAGWGLSDDPLQPMKWVFPATNLAPHSTLIVFASGSDTPIDPAGYLHASFRLSKEGGSLLLSSPSTNMVDQILAYPAQDTDLAYGRDLEGNWTFIEPTPNALNIAPTYLGWLAPLDFSHQRGFHQTAFTLTITNNNAGADLFYSLDGTSPSLLYSSGISITGTKSVRAQARRAGYKSARIQTRTFIFLNDVVASPLMATSITQSPTYGPRVRSGLEALPTISLVLPGQPEYDEKEGSVEILWPDGSLALQENVGVERFGNSWQLFEKRSFRIKCRPEYGTKKIEVPLFDGFDRGVVTRTSFDEIEFRSGSQDMIARGFYLSARFADDSMLEMGSLNPHGRYVHVYLNGVYWGQYDAREPLVEHFLADYLGGSPEDYSRVRGNDNAGSSFVLGIGDPPLLAPWDRVLSLAGSYNALKPYLDVSHLTDFMLLWFYGNCESEFRACGPINAGTGFKFWMADSDGFLRTGAMGQNTTGNSGPGGIFGALVAENNSDFKTLVADRIYKHFFNDGALTPARTDARLVARMNEVSNSILCELARWQNMSIENPLGSFANQVNHTPSGWTSFGATLRSGLFPGRTAQLLSYLRSAGLFPSFDPPTFNQYGGVVSTGFQPQLTTTAGTIYYTLDGSDPRLPGGGVSPAARVWSPGAVTILQETTLSARVLSAGGQWSALAQPRYVLPTLRPPTARDLLISEVHYNPAGADEFEFIELYNASSNPLDLSGVAFSNAVRFIFPQNYTLAPGAFALVVESINYFPLRYQTPSSPYYWPGINVAGEWVGALNNAGETIELLGSNGVVFSSVSYQTGGSWPGRADGGGSSIELRSLPPTSATDSDVRAHLNDGANWRSSSLYHGSPGRFDSFQETVRINELLSHSLLGEDWIELLNISTQAVSLTNCALTDNLDWPDRYLIPGNTILQPGEFLVLNATQLGFAFGEMGEGAALLSLSDTNVMRFLDTVDFPAAPPEESFGIYLRQDGETDFTELLAVTPGTTNAPPRIGPVVFSEILFNPVPGLSEFIELTSLTNAPLDLFDPANPTNVWIVEGIGNFSFPTGTVLAPLSTIIVCATNPETFRLQYGVSNEVPVFGPWAGSLDPDGETLKLMRPGVPQTNGLPMYRVDHLTYRVRVPWPPTNAGLSLQKSPVEDYSNDPLNWTVAAPTPGSNLAPGLKPVIVTQPVNRIVNEGEPVSFSVIATGAPPLVYQWRFNGSSLPAETNSMLFLTNAQVSLAGSYDVVIYGAGGAALSVPATLFVIKPPVITVQPTNQVVRLGSNTLFAVSATGNGILRYQWRLNGNPINGASNAIMNISAAGPADVGAYSVQITDDLGSVLSMSATLTLLADPLITQHPLSQPVLAGSSVTLSVSVTNIATLPINYRWRRGGFTFTNIYVNSYTSYLTLANIQAPNTNWSVIVTNVARPAGVVSSNAFLTILADTNANGLPDAWEAAYGFGPGNPVVPGADPDGDGHTTLQEYTAGTDPTNWASCLRLALPFTTTNALIQFPAAPYRTYTVQFSDGITPAAWTRLADFIARSNSHVESITDPGWNTNRFYRVVLPRVP